MRNRGPRGIQRPASPEISFAKDTTTSDATPKLVTLLETKNGCSYSVEVTVSCISSDKAESAGYKLFAHLRNSDGSLVQVSNGSDTTTVIAEHESDAGLNARFASSGKYIQISITGLAATLFYWHVDGIVTVASLP